MSELRVPASGAAGTGDRLGADGPPRWALPEDAPPEPDRAPSVLIVEDEVVVALDLQLTLEGMGYDAFAIAQSADEALAEVGRRRPDVILMDIRIKGPLDGVETARLLRQQVDAPIVFLTAHADDATVDRAKRVEPQGYLLKPVRPGELRSVIDVALHKHASEVRLRKREQWISTTLGSIGDAVVSVDLHGRVTFLNRAAEQLLGASGAELGGRPVREVLQLLDAQGNPLPDSPLEQALAQRQDVHSAEGFLRRGERGELCTIHKSASPIIHEGEVLGAVMVLRDITEQRRLQRQLEAAARMASLGTLCAGVAHEINNPLCVVVANAEVVREQLAILAASRRAVGLPTDLDCALALAMEAAADVRSGAARIARIVAGLRAFSRPAAATAGLADVRRSIEWAMRATSHQVRHIARMLTRIGDVPPALIDEQELGQVLVNLVINAGQAISSAGGGDHEIEVSCAAVDGRIRVEVRDTGAGMLPEVLERIFEPFFTTKPVDVGTGLGLSVCHGIVARAGGTIEVESQPGRGSTFRVWLRAAAAEPIHAAPATSQPAPALRGRVLVVDDDEDLLVVLRRMLRDHDVLAVSSALTAWELLAKGHHFDLILTDVMMPDLTGTQFHDLLARERPDQAAKVVFLTGGPVTAETEAGLRTAGRPRIDKPFEPHALRATVQRMLSSARSEP